MPGIAARTFVALTVSLFATVLAAPAHAVVDRNITFQSTPDGRSLSHGDPIAGTEWASLGVRFAGQNLRIVNDATCAFCLAGERIAVTFSINGFPAVTNELFINYVNSPEAFTIVGDINGQVLLEQSGDVGAPNGFPFPDIGVVLIRSVGNGMSSFGFDTPILPGSSPPGSSQGNPVLPSEPTLPPVGFFTFINAVLGQWVDPPLAAGYEYEMLSNSTFAAVLDFPTGFQDPFSVSVDGIPLFGAFSPGDAAVLPAGTTKFRITGISPLVDAAQPDAFPVRLAFTTGRASFTMRPLVDPVISMSIDIKPGSNPNCFNLNGQGLLPVAILGTASFDVGAVDAGSLLLDGLRIRVRGNRGPSCSFEDVNADGRNDLVCHFVDDPAYWQGGGAVAKLTGKLVNGTPIEGSDSICIVP